MIVVPNHVVRVPAVGTDLDDRARVVRRDAVRMEPDDVVEPHARKVRLNQPAHVVRVHGLVVQADDVVVDVGVAPSRLCTLYFFAMS